MVPREGRPKLNLCTSQNGQVAAAISKRNLITEQPSGQSNRARTAGAESSSEMLAEFLAEFHVKEEQRPSPVTLGQRHVVQHAPCRP